jgi:hypothetical protein
MAQPPVSPVMARGLSRVIPFVTPRTFLANGTAEYPSLPAAGSVSAEFDTLYGFAEPSLFNNALAYPGVNTPKLHAIGPYLDCLAWSDFAAGGHAAGFTATILVEYATDRGAQYRYPIAPIFLTNGQVANLSGLRITGRFVRVTLANVTSGAAVAINLEFGVYIRSV